MPIKAVIFDLDGTITQPYFDFDAIREEIGMDKTNGLILETMQKMNAQQRQRAEEILHFHEQQAVKESTLNSGARQTLSALRQAGISIGVLTRNKKDNALAVAEKHGLEFDAVIGRDDGPAKPDAFGVLHICKQFKVDPAETLLVGDYLFDLVCAKKAGAVAVLLVNSEISAEFTDHADFCIETIDQILQIIEQCNKASQ
ncbi:MAG: HAD family hydrolase [Planctomycetes bacterium]|nr:HAD family hydrolase [Planctomycetota bacterium]